MREISDEELINAVKLSVSYRDVCRTLGINEEYRKILRPRLVKLSPDTSHFTYRPPVVDSSRRRGDPNRLLIKREPGKRTSRHILVRGLDHNNITRICKSCGLGEEWNNSKLTLEVDHVDGDCSNNLLTNLRWLCPNCHSQTDTNCGKNFSNKVVHRVAWPSDSKLSELLNAFTIKDISVSLGVSTSAVHARCRSRNIERPGVVFWNRKRHNSESTAHDS